MASLMFPVSAFTTPCDEEGKQNTECHEASWVFKSKNHGPFNVTKLIVASAPYYYHS